MEEKISARDEVVENKLRGDNPDIQIFADIEKGNLYDKCDRKLECDVQAVEPSTQCISE